MSDTPTDDELNPAVAPDELTAEEQAAIDAAFDAGFESPLSDEGPGGAMDDQRLETLGDESEAELDEMRKIASGEEDKPADEEVKPEVTPAAADDTPDPTVEQLQERLRKTESRLGNVQQELKKITDAAKARTEGDTPSDRQISDAWKDSEKLKSLQEQFPEFAEALEEVVGMVATGAPAGEAAAPALDENFVQNVVDVARTAAQEEIIADQHENWVEDINSAEFEAWVSAQPEDMQALAESTRARDAIKLLDGFSEFKTYVLDMGEEADKYSPEGLLEMFDAREVESAQQDAEQGKQSKGDSRKRLRSSVPATKPGGGTRQIQDSGDDTESAFAQGFESARGKG